METSQLCRISSNPKGSSELSAIEECWRQGKFFWIGDDSKRSMFGLWLIGKTLMRLTLHLAFEVVKIDELLKIVPSIRCNSIVVVFEESITTSATESRIS